MSDADADHEQQVHMLSQHPRDRLTSFDNLRDTRLEFNRPRRRGVFGLTSSGTQFLEPADGLDPIVRGGANHTNKPEWAVKSVPAFPAHTRQSTRRSFILFWIYQFRHWWKSSRLLVRFAGMYVFAIDPLNWDSMMTLDLLKKKGPKKAMKLIKHLSKGGPISGFLNDVKILTRTIRIVAATWRWIEAPESRRFEVGVAEFFAFMGNRVARIFSRFFADWLASFIVLPFLVFLIERGVISETGWLNVTVLLLLGIIRALFPFIGSFQGSRFGRVVTRELFHAGKDRWLPTMRVDDLNMDSDDCREWDEASKTYSDEVLVQIAKEVAAALGKEHQVWGSEDSAYRSNRYIKEEGFYQVGCGSGGYAVYSLKRGDMSVMLHVTPHGPCILDELPRYIVLEREGSRDTRNAWSQHIARYLFGGTPVVEGYCYKGAFFSPFHFAAMKRRYDQELAAYDKACGFICTTKLTENTPPTDLAALKAFLETGREAKKKRKHLQQNHVVNVQVEKLSREIIEEIKARDQHTGESKCKAPWGVILYFEGLDCSGKSSTGNLVQAALENAGYSVSFCRYNRPPTAEQRKQPWIDRFEYPDTTAIEPRGYQEADADAVPGGACGNHRHAAMVWDRGPGGDFVYGNLDKLSQADKELRYQEFNDFSARLRQKNILFCKLLFVTDRDSIARTLGKRLAQKRIVGEVRNWLDASNGALMGEIIRTGLDEIEGHIDPTDFIAFNSYHDNLNKFMTFAKNTDISDTCKFFNPWTVVNTIDRYKAKLSLLTRFENQFDRFIMCGSGVMTDICDFFGMSHDENINNSKLVEINLTEEHELMSFKKNLYLKIRVVYLAALLLFLIFVYYQKNYGDSD
jgi:polyphosphate kinase 2 (PPK2 family)